MAGFLGTPNAQIRYSIQPDIKKGVRVATTANISDLTKVAVSASSFDGETIAEGDRILLVEQSLAKENGIYVAVNHGTDGYVKLTRAPDADVSDSVNSGMLVLVNEGTKNLNKFYFLTTANPIKLGTTALTFEHIAQLSAEAPWYILGSDGNAVLSVDASGNVTANNLSGTNTGDQTNAALLNTYTQTEVDLSDAVAKKHNHSNKALLDTYTQTDVDITDAISKEHEHSNKASLDLVSGTNTGDQTNAALLNTYTQTEANLADAVAKKHNHSNKALLDTYTQTEIDIADAISKEHTHANKAALDLVSGTNTGDQDLTQAFITPLSDETSTIVTASPIFTFRMPYAFTIEKMMLSLTTPSTSGDVAVTVRVNGSALATVTIAVNSTYQHITVVSGTVGFADSIEFSIDAAGTGAKGLKMAFIGVKY